MIVMAKHTPLQFLILFALTIAIGQSRKVSRAADIRNEDLFKSFKSPFTLTEAYFPMFSPLPFNDTWHSDKEILDGGLITGNTLKAINIETRETRLIINGFDIPSQYSQPVVSPNENLILFSCEKKKMFRHSSIQKYGVYNKACEEKCTFEKIANDSFIALALWSSISDLAYVHNNDIYHMTFNHNQNVVRRLTTSGELNTVYNGIPDWVYEEEVFESKIAMWFSPDGRYLAFTTINNTEVKDIVFMHYGEPGSMEDQYPIEVKLKYPKAGTTNPVISLFVIDVSDPSSKAITLEAPVDVVTRDHVLHTVSWWNETHLIATWTNRVQNQSQMIMYNTQGDTTLVLYDEETHGWVQPNRPIKVDNYALLLRREDSNTVAGKFRHIDRYEYKDGKFIMPVDLTPGPSEVHKILAANSRKVYYLATAPGEPTQRNLYWVPLDGSQKPTCISCELLTPEGNKCTYATASFSTKMSYYTLSCSGPDPTIVRIYNADDTKVLDWSDNWLARMYLSWKLRPIHKDLNITVNGYDCRVRLLLPPDFDESKVYPLLVYVYGGPNTAQIIDTGGYGYADYIATSRNTIYGLIDGRGSANKGSNMLFEIYRKIGTVEIEDTIAVTATLQEQYKWIDRNRTGIWGWSYGGFTTGMVLAQDNENIFKCGISVAPVTSWIYYDSIYTERFMGMPTPEDNLKGYNRTDISRRAAGIRGKKYMLIHGTGDDNVHYQQAMALVKSLERHDIMFEQVVYPDESHSLMFMYRHLYHTMDKFWSDCFMW